MKISYNWLREYIEIKETPEELAKLLTASGSEVKAIDKKGSDYIMEVEVTPNRADCQSYLGIGKEVAAVTGRRLQMPVPKPLSKPPSDKTPFTVEVEDKKLCPRYTARLIRGVRVGPSPDWLKHKILAMGARPVNNIVDITNFCLFESGEPMHAFDYDKLAGRRIIVRRANDKEKIVTIDKSGRILNKDMLIIADAERPIAVAGVMGGLNTEVADGTRNILLEAAIFDPVSVRRTSYTLGLMSDSSYRFERGIDPDIVDRASQRATELIIKVCGGKAGAFVDVGLRTIPKRRVSLRLGRLNRMLGLELSQSEVSKILKGLGFSVEKGKKGGLPVRVPSYRADIATEVDLVEEVVRIYGYEKIKSTIPRITGNLVRKEKSRIIWEKIREFLLSCGLNEIITYSLMPNTKELSLLSKEEELIRVKNPLSAEQAIMRPSLLPGLLNALSYNVNRRNIDLRLFELGNVYYKKGSGHNENMRLSIGLSGAASDDWQRPSSDVSFFDIKGIIEGLFKQIGLGLLKTEFRSHPILSSSESAGIIYKERETGIMGCISGALSDELRLPKKTYLAEISISALTPGLKLERSFQEIPKFPSVSRDISMIVGGKVSFDNIAALVRGQGGALIENVKVFDRYSGKQVPQGAFSIAFRIDYRAPSRTLTDEEVNEVHFRVRQALAERFGVQFR